MTRTQTVGEIARENPASVRVFQKYAIDFCCGGKRPLDEVCQEKGIALDALTGELRQAIAPAAPTEQDWSNAPLSTLIGHIVATHHAYLRQEMPRLDQMLDKVLSKHGEAHGSSLRPLAEAFRGLKSELESHMQKEEMILFPFIVRMEAAKLAGSGPVSAPFGSIRNPIAMMEREHESAGRALAEMRIATDGYLAPEDACATYRGMLHGMHELEADLHQHIHLENNVLFPGAAQL